MSRFTDEDGPDFDVMCFNAEQRAQRLDALAAVVLFPCLLCHRAVPLDELEQHGYTCEECHHARRPDRDRR
jgi:hypothetical protein